MRDGKIKFLALCLGVGALALVFGFVRYVATSDDRVRSASRHAEDIRWCMLNLGTQLEYDIETATVPDGYAESDLARVVEYYFNKRCFPRGSCLYMDLAPEVSLVKLSNEQGFVLLSPNGYPKFPQLLDEIRAASSSEEVSAKLQAVCSKALVMPRMRKRDLNLWIHYGDGVLAYWYERQSDKATSPTRDRETTGVAGTVGVAGDG